MTWQEFNQVFDINIFNDLMKYLNGESDAKHEKQKKDRRNRRYSHNNHAFRSYQYLSENVKYELLPIVQLDNKYIIKYTKTSKNRDNFEEIILGYFQEFEKGYVFVSLDSSHMWKKVRESVVLKSDSLQKIILGSNMIFCDLSQIETSVRYYFKKENGLDESSFFFKENCVRINDVYVGSNKSFRYFLVLDFTYTSSDFTTNNYVSCETFFDHIKNLNNSDILVIFDQSKNLKSQQEVMQRYSDKMIKKLLKL